MPKTHGQMVPYGMSSFHFYIVFKHTCKKEHQQVVA